MPEGAKECRDRLGNALCRDHIKKQIRQALAGADLHDAEAERTRAESRRRRAEAAEQQKRKARTRNARLARLKKDIERLKEQREKQYQREEEEEKSRRRRKEEERKEEEQRRKEERREREPQEETSPPTGVEAKDMAPPGPDLLNSTTVQAQKVMSTAMANNTRLINSMAEFHRQNSAPMFEIGESGRQEPVVPLISRMPRNIERNTLSHLFDVNAKAVDFVLELNRMQGETKTESRRQEHDFFLNQWQSATAFAKAENKRSVDLSQVNRLVNKLFDVGEMLIRERGKKQVGRADVPGMVKDALNEALEGYFSCDK